MRTRVSSQWTAANIVTCIRIFFMPVWLFAAEAASTALDTGKFSFASFGIALFFAALSFTDSLDGYLARSRNEVTTFGKFLDPIADKLVVIVGLLYLLEKGLVPSWAIMVVVAREFLVSGLRMLVATSGTVISASMLGKVKTATTMGMIIAFLVYLSLPAGLFANIVKTLSDIALYVAVALTAWSGIDYFLQSKDALFDE